VAERRRAHTHTVSEEDLLRVLAQSISTPLTPEELAELRERVAQQEEMSRLLQSVPLDGEDPHWPPGEEPL
jgi:hypothetical protein